MFKEAGSNISPPTSEAFFMFSVPAPKPTHTLSRLKAAKVLQTTAFDFRGHSGNIY